MIIVIDLDHTLLKEDGSISDHTLKVLKKCKDCGYKIIINSARSYVRTKDYAEKIHADYINCFYGNLVVDAKGKILFSKALERNALAGLILRFKDLYNGWIGIECVEGGFGTDPIAKRFGGVVVSENEILKYNPLKLIFELEDTPENRKKAKEIADDYDLDVKFGREGFFCSLLPKNTNKWYGLQKILKRLKCKGEKVIAFGDEISDFMTFQNVDYGVAMKNSTKELLDQSQYVTLSNEEDGVAYFIEQMLLKKIEIGKV